MLHHQCRGLTLLQNHARPCHSLHTGQELLALGGLGAVHLPQVVPAFHFGTRQLLKVNLIGSIRKTERAVVGPERGQFVLLRDTTATVNLNSTVLLLLKKKGGRSKQIVSAETQ